MPAPVIINNRVCLTEADVREALRQDKPKEDKTAEYSRALIEFYMAMPIKGRVQ